MASKSYGWDVRNIAKISPKMVKKGPFFDFRKKPKPTPLPHMRLWFFDTPEVTEIVLPKVVQNFKLPLLAQGIEPKWFPT